VLLSHNFLYFLLLFKLFLVNSIHLEVLLVFHRVTPFKLVHHVLMLVTEHGQSQWFLETIGPPQGYILIAKYGRKEAAEVSALHEGVIFS
jgi:hypothetical protein